MPPAVPKEEIEEDVFAIGIGQEGFNIIGLLSRASIPGLYLCSLLDGRELASKKKEAIAKAWLRFIIVDPSEANTQTTAEAMLNTFQPSGRLNILISITPSTLLGGTSAYLGQQKYGLQMVFPYLGRATGKQCSDMPSIDDARLSIIRLFHDLLNSVYGSNRCGFDVSDVFVTKHGKQLLLTGTGEGADALQALNTALSDYPLNGLTRLEVAQFTLIISSNGHYTIRSHIECFKKLSIYFYSAWLGGSLSLPVDEALPDHTTRVTVIAGLSDHTKPFHTVNHNPAIKAADWDHMRVYETDAWIFLRDRICTNPEEIRMWAYTGELPATVEIDGEQVPMTSDFDLQGPRHISWFTDRKHIDQFTPLERWIAYDQLLLRWEKHTSMAHRMTSGIGNVESRLRERPLTFNSWLVVDQEVINMVEHFIKTRRLTPTFASPRQDYPISLAMFSLSQVLEVEADL